MKTYRYLLLALYLLCAAPGFAATVDTLQTESAAMGKTWRAGVVLPQSYKKSKTSFPVLYLLHGYSGNFRNWLTKTTDKQLLLNLADQYNIIIVTPDGGFSGWYLDSPINKENQFETFISQELINKVDNTYRTIRDRKGRVISGLSMGGHGALYLATRHPDIYCAAGSMSGALDLTKIIRKDIDQYFASIIGPRTATPDLYQENSVVYMIDKMKENNLPLIIDCGVDDILIEMNRELHRRLVYSKVPHEYTERPGAHTWPYWSDALPFHLLFFQKVLQQNGVLPQLTTNKK